MGGHLKPQLLLVCNDIRVMERLTRELQASFEVWWGETPAIAEERLRRLPDLVVAEHGTLERTAADWSAFVDGCELSGVRCVVFGTGDVDSPRLPCWCEHYLPDITSPAWVREYLKALTQLNETLHQLELRQGKLLACKFEQAEGLRSAAHIQQSLMPDTFPDLPGISFAHCFQPCQNVVTLLALEFAPTC